jgi:hypothetical protein
VTPVTAIDDTMGDKSFMADGQSPSLAEPHGALLLD